MSTEQAMPLNQQAFVQRFVAACQADAHVLAAFIGGSHAKGAADQHSDLDLTIITTDAATADFFTARATFLGNLGDLVFLEDFGHPNLAFIIYADGAEVELWFSSPSTLEQIQCGPYRVLLDKQGLLEGVQFPIQRPGHDEQMATVQRLLDVFWHDLSHFITAMTRGQLWWAIGQIGELRGICMNLARLRYQSTADTDGHEKVEKALPAEFLAKLTATCCPLEREAIVHAGQVLVGCYQELAQPLVAAYRLPYPAALEQVMLERMSSL